MEANKIADTDLLDIIFEGRNKEYGAYDLRRTYNRRLMRSLGVAAIVGSLLLIGWVHSGAGVNVVKPWSVDTVNLRPTGQIQKPVVPLPPPRAPRVRPQQVAMMADARPVIVKDLLASEQPQDQKVPDDMKIGVANQPGVTGAEVVDAPVSGTGTGVLVSPGNNGEKAGDGFEPVEIESEYPGGTQAWQRYLNKEFRYPEAAISIEMQGVVEVQFIVDKDGNVSDVQAVNGPTNGGLREEAIRVIKKSGKWTPAVQNGRHVKSYKRQSIVFRLNNE